MAPTDRTLVVDERAPGAAGGPDRAHRLVPPAGVATGALVFLTVVHLVDPNQPGNYPTCPWLAITGTYCPGCGSLRATNALTHGHLREALARNPLAVAAYAVLVVVFATWVSRAWTGRSKTVTLPSWAPYALLVVVLAFWVLRNIPGWTWLSPA